ncbi:MAG: hypothetical protein ABSH32_19905 [Bryobacteraceae bacterium]|jgi:hypothetical protein
MKTKASQAVTAVLIGLFISSVAGFAQPYSAADRRPDGYVFNPTLITSADCIGDFVKMQSIEGVAKRKLAADLIQTGCVVTLKGIYVIPHFLSENITRGGKVFVQTKPALAVVMMEAAGLNPYASQEVEDAVKETLGLRRPDGDEPIKGYVASSDLLSEQR